jgi:FkbM family methyltransferase
VTGVQTCALPICDRYFPVALAAQAGEATLHVTDRISMTSTLLPNSNLLARFWDKPQHTRIVSTQVIPTDTLDHVLEESGILLDAIKIDVQGGEQSILDGARESFKRSVITAEIELSFLERYSGLTRFHEVVGFMDGLGFDLIDIGRIKRYRYRNNAGIVNPGLGLGDRAGRIAFCDATFMLRDEALRDRLLSSTPANGEHATLKAIMLMLVHGKADIAAWLFDAASQTIDQRARDALGRYLDGLGGKHFGRKGFHKALDYLARRV